MPKDWNPRSVCPLQISFCRKPHAGTQKHRMYSINEELSKVDIDCCPLRVDLHKASSTLISIALLFIVIHFFFRRAISHLMVSFVNLQSSPRLQDEIEPVFIAAATYQTTENYISNLCNQYLFLSVQLAKGPCFTALAYNLLHRFQDR